MPTLSADNDGLCDAVFLAVTPKSNASRRPTIITNALASFRTLCNRKGLTVGNRAVLSEIRGFNSQEKISDRLTKIRKRHL